MNNVGHSTIEEEKWLTREENLLQSEENLHIQVDKDLHLLSTNFVELVSMGKIKGKDSVDMKREQMEMEIRCVNLVKAAESLLNLTRDLKESIIVNDVRKIKD